MTIKLRLVKGNAFGLPSGTVDQEAVHRERKAGRLGLYLPQHSVIRGHIQRVDTGRVYEGVGVNDLRRRLDYWETRVADFAAMASDAEGEAKKKAAKLLKDGNKLLNTIRDHIAEREAA